MHQAKTGLRCNAQLASGTRRHGRLSAPLALTVWVLVLGAMLDGAGSVMADSLEWTASSRPPLTDAADTEGKQDGYNLLTAFGNVEHPIAVAANGDVFVAGGNTDVDRGDGAGGPPDGDCGDPEDTDRNRNAACDFGAPVMYKSVDGGLSWRQATWVGAQAGALVRAIAVSPDYPRDNFVIVVFSDLDRNGSTGDAMDGLAISTDGGNTFRTSFTGATAGANDLDETEWTCVALSPDFNFDEQSGSLAIGGWFAGDTTGEFGTTFRANAKAFRNAPSADATWLGYATSAPEAEAPGDRVLHLAYAADAGGENRGLGRLWVDGSNGKTYGQVSIGVSFDNSRGGEILAADASSMIATMGQLAFDDDYRDADSGFFVAVAGSGTKTGGMYKYAGSWTNATSDEGDCNVDMASLAVTGNGKSAKIIATESSGNTVCRSSNGGLTFSSVEFDGGNDVVRDAKVAAGVVIVAVGGNAAGTAYLTSSGNLGGVSKSVNNGASWLDMGLTNQPYVVSSVIEITESSAFAMGSASGLTALFHTDNYGPHAGWRRVDRTPNVEILESAGLFTNENIGYLYRTQDSSKERILKSIDGGMTYHALAFDPAEDEQITATLFRTGSSVYLGTDNSNIYYTSDAGGSWTKVESSMHFDGRIDEFDFVTGTTTWILTALHQNTKRLWLTKDNGATFTEVPGGAPWGDGDITITVSQVGYSDLGAGTLFVDTAADMWRMTKGANTWTELNLNRDISSFMSTIPLSGTASDGREYFLWDNGGAFDQLWLSFNLLAAAADDIEWEDDDADISDNDLRNVLLRITPPPSGAGTVGTRTSAPERTLQNTQTGKIWEMVLSDKYRRGPAPTSPADRASIAPNTGHNGMPTVFRWTDIPEIETWELVIGLSSDLRDGTFIKPNGAAIPNILAVVDSNDYPLIAGNRYYWKVRSKTTANGVFESPWSTTRSFTVGWAQRAGSMPEPLLPLEGSTIAKMEPIQFSFNLPAGTTQYHIEVMPLYGDGPAINMVVGDPNLVASGAFTVLPPVLGQGNYVLLPGATYTWRVRATMATGSIAATDGGWSPWSAIRVFHTPRPRTSTISLQVVGTGNVSTDMTPTFRWTDGSVSTFWYEVQLSSDPTFNQDVQTATRFVYHNLVHGGISVPLNSWTLPDSAALAEGTYFWRVRPRVQATSLGAGEPGVEWSAAMSFAVQTNANHQ